MRQMRRRNSVLVLGAGGKVGTLLRRFWARTPPRDIRPVFQTSKRHGDDLVIWRAGDDPADLPAAQTIVALWGVTPGNGAAFELNQALGCQALDIAAAVGAGRVLLASSAAVYSGSRCSVHCETEDLPMPANAYGRSKLAMERAVRRWISEQPRPPRLVSLRLGNVIGADQLFGNLEQDEVIRLDRFASGVGPVRSYLAIPDLARVIETLACSDAPDLPDVLNVAGSQPLAMAELASLAARKVVWHPAPHGALERLQLDTSRLRALVGDCAASSDPARAIESWKALRVPA